ncbi:alpha-galactosidase [Labrys wisconsinensis]|uniref:alpha-galactosidase n=1 Tax=Labrys wisconsinensis TaxID=425677 RepID=A0ABU0JF64_9HYPH|nr:alpha-galactosidase [Labrys wisconsinensis]MDQ0472245.1 alpha-galactosidase [Labrys wisconsinensis]
MAADFPVVHLAGPGSSLLVGLPERGMPPILGWSRRAHRAPAGLQAAAVLAARGGRPNSVDGPAPPAAVLLPTGALGNPSWPAIQGHRDGRDWTLEFRDWTAEERPGAAVLRATDPVARVALAVELAMSAGDVLTMRVCLTNGGETPYQLDRCMAGTMLVDAAAGDVLSFEGAWCREFHQRRDRLGAAVWLQENRRGRTSHDRSPTLVLAAAEEPGLAYGLHLGWSGNHVLAIDRLDDGRRLVHAGEWFEPGEMRLAPGEAYESPTVHMLARPDGVEGIARGLAAHVRADVLTWPGGAMTPRPVILNTWEGTYFSQEVETLKAQASAAAALGVERFVVDDGWFGRRDDDGSSLGDWTVDRRKYPDGLKPLVDHVTGLGMAFGLWLEPEMVSPESDLHRAHPDWALQVQGRPLLTARRQLVLDLTRADVFDHVFGCVDALLSELAIVHIKWDMNRDLAAAGDRAGRPAAARRTRAAYALIDKVRAAHPRVEIENCSGGGGRIDYGILARTHRSWLSDCTDPVERLEIQAGAALFLPPEVMGCDISPSPNHLTGRAHDLAFRALVAMEGHLGIELDPLKLAEGERAELAGWIALYKRLRPVLHGAGTRFRQPVRDGRHVYGVVDNAAGRILVFVAEARLMLREAPPPVRIAGADPARAWRVAGVHPAAELGRFSAAQKPVFTGERAVGGDDLAIIGLPVPMLGPEAAVLIELEAE